MKNIIQNKIFLAVALFAFSFIAMLTVSQDSAYAATKTWTGGGSDSNWSTAANWSPSGAPTNGDDIVFTMANSSITTINDITNLSVNSILVNGSTNNSGHNVNITISDTMDIAGNVTHSATGGAVGLTIAGGVVLGADVIATNTTFANSISMDKTLSLNGHSLTIKADSTYTSTTLGIGLPITGNGTLTIDIENSRSMYLAQGSSVPGGNTYSGTTNIVSGTISTSGGGHSNLMFGSSVVNVGPTATLSITPDNTSPYTFNNTINVAAAVVGESGFLTSQIYVWPTVNNQVVNIPNIVLSGNARFESNTSTYNNLVVNLAGIQAGSFCVQYGNTDNSKADDFLNGPPACVIGDDDTAGVPNTGFNMLKNNPLATILITSIATIAILVIARKRIALNS